MFSLFVACLLAPVAAEHKRGVVESDGSVQLQLVTEATSDTRDAYFDLLIVVPTMAKERRQLIRETWGKYLGEDGHCKACGDNQRDKHTVKVLFGISKNSDEKVQRALEEEKEKFKDLVVLEDEVDSPEQQATKMRMLIEHAVANYQFTLLLKVDPSSWIFMSRLLELAEGLKLFERKEDIYGGYFATERTITELEGRFVDDSYTKITGHHRFPMFANGAGYLLSRKLCRHIANFPKVVEDEDDWAPMPQLQTLANEDVSVGFWLQPVEHQNVDLPISLTATGCQNRSQIIDLVGDKEMTRRWDALKNKGDPCAM